MILFLAWNAVFTDYKNLFALKFLEMKNVVSFWAKELMDRWYLLITKKFMFWIFLSQKNDEGWYLLITEKFLIWTFRWWEILSFYSQKVDGKMIMTWSFWAFHYIPGIGKYGFSCSVHWMLLLKIYEEMCYKNDILLRWK